MAAVLAAAAIVAGIAAVDSLNPGTLGPALVLAVSEHPVRRILEFGISFFAVNFAGGVLLALGPGHWLFSHIPSPSDAVLVAAGAVLIGGAIALLALRKRLTRPRDRDKPKRRMSGSALLLGGGIALAELPTALPYFAALAALGAADLSVPADIALVALFNVIFLAPVFGLALLIRFFPDTWERFVNPVRAWMSRHWPYVLAGLLGAGGVALVVAGLSS